VYVLLLWTLREKPLAFGAVLAFGFLHREFTVFAVPALIVANLARTGWLRAFVTRLPRMALGSAAVWLVVDDLRMHLSGEPLARQALSLGTQMCLSPAGLPMRIRALVTQALPAQYGGLRVLLAQLKMNTPLAAGSMLVGGLLAVTFAFVVWRLAAADRR